MTSAEHAASTPRWGSAHRDEKGRAILSTMIAVLGPDVANEPWLDVGCGSGGIAAELSKHVASVVGVDPEAWPHWPELISSNPGLRLLQRDCRALETIIPNGSIGIAVCNQVYEHVLDVPTLLAEIFKAIRPGGYCYFAGPNLLWPIEPHVFYPFVHWLPREGTIRVLSGIGLHRIRELDAWSMHYWALRGHFRAAGFEVSSLLVERLLANRRRVANAVLLRALKLIAAGAEPLAPGFVFLLRKPAAP